MMSCCWRWWWLPVAVMGAVLFFASSVLAMARPDSGDSASAAVLQQWDFNDPDFAFAHIGGCKTTIKDGLLDVELTQGDVMLVLPRIDVPGPVRVQIRMKSGNGAFGQAELYWQQNKNQGWSEARYNRYYLQHDNEWHEYDFPLSALGRFAQLRFDPGWKKGAILIDWIRIVSDDIPSEIQSAVASLPKALSIADDTLKVTLNPHANTLTVDDKRTGRRWHTEPDGKTMIIATEKTSPTTLKLTLWDNALKNRYFSEMMLERDGVLSFTLDAEKRDVRFDGTNLWPPALRTDLQNGKMMFCSRSSGNYLDQTDDFKHWQKQLVYGNLSMDMPWFGLIDEQRGDGLMMLLETPYDVQVILEADEQGRNWPQVFWWQSMDTFRYARRMSYRFSPAGGYVNLARMYRRHAEQTGKLITLQEKARRKPAVELLRGAPMIWGARDAWDFALEARTWGITRGVLSNSHQGLQETASLARLNAMGYITNEYENISDIVEGPTGGFFTDSIEEASFHLRPDMGPALGWHGADGTQYSSRSSSKAMRAITNYMPGRIDTYKFNGRFIDVSAALDLFEDYHPEHTADRRQDMKYRREVFEYVSNYGPDGLVLGTEHGNDWVIDLVEYVEGAAGGPLWWDGGWNPGELTRPESRDVLKKSYLKYGMGFDNRTPLWQLVYHDCVVSTWYWGAVQGTFYDIAPDLTDRMDLHNILYGTVPLFWRDQTYFDWTRNRKRFLQTYHETCHLNRAIGFEEMLNHEFLNADKTLQRSTFASGTVAVVNFGEKPLRYDANGQNVTLAPRGYYVKGPEIFQSRELVNGKLLVRVVAPGVFRTTTESLEQVGPAELQGTVTAVKIDENRWNIGLDDCTRCVIDPTALLAVSNKDVRVMTVGKYGALTGELRDRTADGKLVFTTKDGSGVFAILLNAAGKTFILPEITDLAIGDLVSITTAKTPTVRYTLDGTDPTASSPLYTQPFTLKTSTTVKAQRFDTAGKAVGETLTRSYRANRELFRSEMIVGPSQSTNINVDISAANTLVLLVDDCSTFPHWDYANWINARIITADGQEQFLSALQPTLVLQDHYDLGINGRVRQAARAGDVKKPSKPMQLNGTTYSNGLGMISPGRVEFTLPANAARFQCLAASDDAAAKAKFKFVVQAIY